MNILNSPVDYTKTFEFAEALQFGGMILLIGILAVFAVLGLIWAVLSVFKFVFTKDDSNEKVTEAPKPAPSAPVVTRTATDYEIVAVIAAAIAMAESESGNGIKFRVVSFRKK